MLLQVICSEHGANAESTADTTALELAPQYTALARTALAGFCPVSVQPCWVETRLHAVDSAAGDRGPGIGAATCYSEH